MTTAQLPARDLPDNIVIGISACLQGHKVRYNGEAKRRNAVLENLKGSFQLETVCPEVGIGLGVPRETIRLVDIDGEDRARPTAGGEDDFTGSLRAFARNTLAAHSGWSGYIGVKGSPSCGYERIKRYGPTGNFLGSEGVGIFIDEIRRTDPLLPVEEDGRLNDAGLCHSFIIRVVTHARWRAFREESMRAAGLSVGGLVEFYSRHKYLLMAHSRKEYKALGRLVAEAGKRDPEELGAELIRRLLEAFRTPANRRGHTDVLFHLSGYLKRKIDARERGEIRDLIEQYRKGEVPLVVPVTLLNSYFDRHPDPYIAGQLFLLPFPARLGLRNRL